MSVCSQGVRWQNHGSFQGVWRRQQPRWRLEASPQLPVEAGNCCSTAAVEASCWPTNISEILWTSSPAAETAVINSPGYFQATLVRFTQAGADLVWLWLQDWPTSTQQSDLVNCELVWTNGGTCYTTWFIFCFILAKKNFSQLNFSIRQMDFSKLLIDIR